MRQTISSQPDAPVSLICWQASARWASQGNSLFLSPWTSAALFQRDPLTWNNPLSTAPPRLSTAPSLFPSTLTRASSFSLKVGYSLTPYLPYSGYLSFRLSSELMTNFSVFLASVMMPVHKFKFLLDGAQLFSNIFCLWIVVLYCRRKSSKS